MSSRNVRPKWWQVYLTLPLLLALFAVENRLKLSSRGHQTVQIGIVLLVFGLVHLWLRANAQALSRMDWEEHQRMVRGIHIRSYEYPDTEGAQRPLFKIPDSEIKGVLSNTFEMDRMEVELPPSEEISQELNKE